MSAGTTSFVSGSSGPTNTGSGNQNIGPIFNFDSLLERFVRMRRDPRAIEHEHLCWLRRRFVEPRHYGRARELLEERGSVLLTGAPGSGKRAASQMLLHRLAGADGQIWDLPDEPDSPNEPVLDDRVIDFGRRLLLDLSVGGDKNYGAVLGELPSFRALVQERRAHLVVVLPYSREYQMISELGTSVNIVRSDGMMVFQRYLRSDGITFAKEQLGVVEQTVSLRSEPMQRIAELAKLVQLAKESEATRTFPHWLNEALAALTERGDEVAKQMTTLLEGQQRTPLLATAMFSGAHADAIFQATSRLRVIVRQPEDERPQLERDGVAEQLVGIGATTDDAGLVHFRSLAYDQAVRTHFWTNFPDLREGFRDWMAEAVRQQTLTAEDRDMAVTRFAEQALRTNRPSDLLFLAEFWVQGPSHLLPQVAKALERGLSDRRHGRFFRQQLYDWSRNPDLSHDLTQVVIQLCSEILGLTHPYQAVVRLHHIVRRQSDVAGEAAHDALLDLTDRDRRLYHYLLERVTIGRKTTYYTAADLALFLELAVPARLTDSQQQARPLIEEETVQEQLVTGWAAVLDWPSSLPYGRDVQAWLAASLDDQYREPLLNVLVKAGGGRDDLLSHLYVIARDWAHTPDEHQVKRRAIATHLTDKIDSALGIDFTGLDLGHSTEGTAP